MRFIALLFLGLSLAAYRSLKTESPQVLEANAAPREQATNLLFQSADDGQTWQDVSLGLPKSLIINTVFTQGDEVFLGTEKGLYHSRNPQTGVWEREGLGQVETSEFGLISLNERITGIFPGQSGPYVCVDGAGFFRKSPGTNRWQPMHGTLTDKRIYAVVEKPDGTLFVGCAGGIFTSKDDGKTWRQVFSEGWVNSLVTAGDAIVGSGLHGLLRSTNGEHWALVLPDENATYRTSTIEGRFAAVRLGGAARNCAQVNPLLTSADGQSWLQMEKGPLPDQRIYDFEQVGTYLLCSFKTGIYRSADGGINWELVRPSVDTKEPLRVELGVLGKTVFAVMVRSGC